MRLIKTNSVYLETKKKEESAEKAAQKSAASNKASASSADKKKSTAKPNHNAGKKISNKEKREYAALENKIPELEEKKAELEKLLYPTPPTDYEELQKLSGEIAAIAQEIETATERWMELAELIS